MNNNFLNPIIDNLENINPVNREWIAEYATLPLLLLLFLFAIELDRTIGANNIVSSLPINSIFLSEFWILISIFVLILSVLPGYIMESNSYYIGVK